MSDQNTHHPYQILQPQWRKKTLNVFMDALWRYYETLCPHKKAGNTKINNELKKIQKLRKHIKKYWLKGESEFYLTSLPLEAQNYGFLNDVLWKYLSAKRQEFTEKEKATSIKAANESLKSEVELLRNILAAPFWEKIQREKMLTDSVYKSPKDTSSEKSMIQNQIVIGDVYGQVIGVNKGQVIQESNYELLVMLQKLFGIVSLDDNLNSKIKSNAIGDIQTIQSQIMKKNPDKNILTRAKGALGVLADTIQVGEFAVKVIPLIKQITEKLLLY